MNDGQTARPVFLILVAVGAVILFHVVMRALSSPFVVRALYSVTVCSKIIRFILEFIG